MLTLTLNKLPRRETNKHLSKEAWEYLQHNLNRRVPITSLDYDSDYRLRIITVRVPGANSVACLFIGSYYGVQLEDITIEGSIYW